MLQWLVDKILFIGIVLISTNRYNSHPRH